MQKQVTQLVKGMQRDLAVSKVNNEFSYENHNIRIATNEGNTFLTITNEKGNASIPDIPIIGTILGHCVLDKYIIVFSKGEEDCIHRIHLEEGVFKHDIILSGDMQFNVNNPIEAVGIYETENLQKIYWVDGINQMRFLNIAPGLNGELINPTEINHLSFAPEIDLKDTISVSKVDIAGGLFAPGTIQYAFSYHNLYGQETNIFNVSDLQYISFNDRGASPEDTCNCAFTITIENYDTTYDYIKVYSIHRTSVNGTPITKEVTELKIEDKLGITPIVFTDTGTIGYNIDITSLFFKGMEDISPYTFTHKDNTLFIGNYTLNTPIIPEEIRENLKNYFNAQGEIYSHKSPIAINTPEGYYTKSFFLNNSYKDITTFKQGEYYRFGIQFQYKTGRWSEVIFLGDVKNDVKINTADNFIQLIGGSFRLEASTITSLQELGFVRCRSMVVYPEIQDRNILAQGIVSPTLFDLEDRGKNAPFVQSSWFHRPMLPVDIYATNETGGINSPKGQTQLDDWTDASGNKYDAVELGAWAEFRHNRGLPGRLNRNGEIQSSAGILGATAYTGDTNNAVVYVDNSIVTLHSPDIEFDTVLQNLENSKMHMRIVGFVPIISNASDYYLTTSSAGVISSNASLPFKLNNPAKSYFGIRSHITAELWKDYIKDSTTTITTYPIYPWHRQQSLVFSTKGDDIMYAELENKIISNIKYSHNSMYLNTPWVPTNDISNVNIFNSNEVIIEKLQIENCPQSQIDYYGNVDKVYVNDNGYPLTTVEDGKIVAGDIWAHDPISIKYKSTPHAIFGFNYDASGNPIILPSLNGQNRTEDTNKIPKWNYDPENIINITQGNIEVPSDYGGFWLAELYREDSEIPNRFGGNSNTAINSNTWVPCTSPTDLQDRIYLEYGDTYYQRYDNLKTYPFTEEDPNSIVDIVSFMCETRINIDGRYDKNRGTANNTFMTPTNFNLLNTAYTQKDNFFSYNGLDLDKFNTSLFKNSVSWSMAKVLGDEIDAWTNIQLTSNLEMDGDKGAVQSLNTFNNEIYCFQDMGISNILFNSRTQIPTTDGVPIEISNGLGVGGKRYISNSMGCTNKWSIVESPYGIYYIDNITKSINIFNGKITDITNSKGFKDWISQYDSLESWKPEEFNNFISFYDKAKNEVYFINKDTALCYSEVLQQFTSFMSYEQTPIMFNYKNGFYSIKNNTLWEQNAGDYNYFFGEYRPFSITYIVNGGSGEDKIFNNVEFRADSIDTCNRLTNSTFDTIEAWNEYQYGKNILKNTKGYPSSLKEKFRIWRANIPRDSAQKRNRMRNPWIYLKISKQEENKLKTQLHDLVVSYF